MTSLLEKIHALEFSLSQAEVPHAFGGALALAYCVSEPRATADIDVNIYLPPEEVEQALVGLPDEVQVSDKDRNLLRRDGQARLWWDETPIDIFLSTSRFHDDAFNRVRQESLDGQTISLLACDDLAVFKAFFNRRKDWADLEAMVSARSFDVDRALGTLVRLLGSDDPRIEMLREIVNEPKHDRSSSEKIST